MFSSVLVNHRPLSYDPSVLSGMVLTSESEIGTPVKKQVRSGPHTDAISDSEQSSPVKQYVLRYI